MERVSVISESPPQTPTVDNFSKLPAELRNRIYALVLADRPVNIRQSRYRRRYGNTRSWREPSIMTVSKLMRREASQIYYSINPVAIHIGTAGLPRACEWLTSVTRECGKNPFKDFKFVINSPKWDDVQKLFAVAQLVHETGVELHTSQKPFKPSRNPSEDKSVLPRRDQSPHSIFQMATSVHVIYQDTLEEAVALGRQANRSGWSGAMLRHRFGRWAKEKLASQHVKNLATRRLYREKTREKRNYLAYLDRTDWTEHRRVVSELERTHWTEWDRVIHDPSDRGRQI